jgi:hypothetical protein
MAWEYGFCRRRGFVVVVVVVVVVVRGGKTSNGESKPTPHVCLTVSDAPGTTAVPIRVAYKTSRRAGRFRESSLIFGDWRGGLSSPALALLNTSETIRPWLA